MVFSNQSKQKISIHCFPLYIKTFFSFPLTVYTHFFPVHAHLKCDKTSIHTTVGRDINVICRFDLNNFIFSKKYWCHGESRNTCEVLMDTDGFTTSRLKNKARIYQSSFQTFNILITGVQLEDTGIYWAGIDKLYADIMFRINVVVTEGKVLTSVSYVAQLIIYKFEKMGGKNKHMRILHSCKSSM